MILLWTSQNMILNILLINDFGIFLIYVDNQEFPGNQYTHSNCQFENHQDFLY